MCNNSDYYYDPHYANELSEPLEFSWHYFKYMIEHSFALQLFIFVIAVIFIVSVIISVYGYLEHKLRVLSDGEKDDED